MLLASPLALPIRSPRAFCSLMGTMALVCAVLMSMIQVGPAQAETPAKTNVLGRITGRITDAAMSHRAECVMLNKGPHVLSHGARMAASNISGKFSKPRRVSTLN